MLASILKLIYINDFLYFYINVSMHRESNLIIVQQDATYSVYYISVGSSTCFECRHPSSGAGTAVIHKSVPTQQRERMVVHPVNLNQKL